MKNIHILPTDKPSRLIFDKEDGLLHLQDEPIFMEHQDLVQNQNIYITSDEEINKCYYIDELGQISKAFKNNAGFYKNCKKIILTTDQDLINDGVQAIDDEFLEWFVKNPSCEFAHLGFHSIIRVSGTKRIYKIIIPKEEQCTCKVGEPYNNLCCKVHGNISKEEPLTKLQIAKNIAAIGIGKKEEPKQETLEEASWKFNPLKKLDGEFLRAAFIKGAKWQAERMYSEEDLREAFNVARHIGRKNIAYEFDEWFNRHKKKL